MIPRVCYPDLVPEDVEILTREGSTNVDGNVSDFEIDVINRLVKYNKPLTIFEIGTFDGRTTLNMAANSSPDTRLYTLDLPPSSIDQTALNIDLGDRLFIDKPASGLRFAGTDVAHKITQLFGDSATYDFSPFFGQIDFLFVDGSHSYEYVLNDSEIALSLIRKNGIILWHDYVPVGPTPWPGLTKALNEIYSRDSRFMTMKHIAGTAIVMRQEMAESNAKISSDRRQDRYRDSSQPEYLLASLAIELRATTVRADTSMSFAARATNIGRAIWLASDDPKGPVRLGSHLLDADGNYLDQSYSRHNLPGSSSVAPGQCVSFEGTLPSPPVGQYVLEFDLVAEGVAWFARNGSTSVRIPIEVR